VAVSVATFLAGQSTLDKIIGGFAISDTPADVAQQLDALSADTNVTSITLTGGGVQSTLASRRPWRSRAPISGSRVRKDTTLLSRCRTPRPTSRA
jgi:hypothetical protein